MKARVFWIYDARAGGRLSGDTPHCVPCSEARAGDPGPESGKASVWSPLPPPALLLRRGSNRGENLRPHARLTGADRWSVRPALEAPHLARRFRRAPRLGARSSSSCTWRRMASSPGTRGASSVSPGPARFAPVSRVRVGVPPFLPPDRG